MHLLPEFLFRSPTSGLLCVIWYLLFSLHSVQETPAIVVNGCSKTRRNHVQRACDYNWNRIVGPKVNQFCLKWQNHLKWNYSPVLHLRTIVQHASPQEHDVNTEDNFQTDAADVSGP